MLVQQKLTVAQCARQYVRGKYAKVAQVFKAGVSIGTATVTPGKSTQAVVVPIMVAGKTYRYKFVTGRAFGPGEGGHVRIFSVKSI